MSNQKQPHSERKHSDFSASGASRWFRCSGSVALSRGVPSKDTKWSLEGTRAHEVLESIMRGSLLEDKNDPPEMVQYAKHSANFIHVLLSKSGPSELLIESRVMLDFIHPEAFGSLDYAIVEYFGTLDILDFKYGLTLVDPKENLQFIFYALGVAHLYNWNFSWVRMWTLQPRVKNFDGYMFWEISIHELKKYVSVFKKAIERTELYPDLYVEGDHCFFCPAKARCPLKQSVKNEKARMAFMSSPIN